MGHNASDLFRDAMQVCRNGHVITDLAHTFPERRLRYCDRCGATTMDRCLTCGVELPGAVHVPGLSPVGARRPPHGCAACGAAFPWVGAVRPALAPQLVPLEAMLRRLPLVARQLRARQGDRPPFRVEDEKDLEDLLRALLTLTFDDIRPESRTPRYASGTRTDFLLAPQRVAVTAKYAPPGAAMQKLGDQLLEDAAHYRERRDCRTLVGLIYDPLGQLHEPRLLEAAWSVREEEWELRCIISTPVVPTSGAHQ